jgi:hypothetical protein
MTSSHPALRIFTVIGLALFFCVMNLPDLVRTMGYPDGDLGFRTDGTIATIVTPDLPAARAGIREGDRLDLSRLTSAQRSAVIGGYLPSPGDKAQIGFWHRGKYRPSTLTAVPEQTRSAYIIIREVVFFIPMLIGVLLVLLRPSAITWGFFLFSLTAGGSPPNSVSTSRFSGDWNTEAALTLSFVIFGIILPKIGLVLFAFSLARRAFTPWIWAALGATFLLGVIEAAPVVAHPELAGNGSWPALTAFCEIAAAAIALAGLVYAYMHVALRLRQRLHWIAAGFILWIIVDAIDALLWPAYESYAFHTAIDASQIIFPLTVTYAIFRERVIDINFVVSRTLAYGLLTTAIVGVFALLDLFLSRTMEARFSLPVDIVVALVLGFFFHALRGRIDAGVDRVVFRKRHVAEMRLARAAKAVVHVDDAASIPDYLTQLPAEVLDLTGAALYMRRGSRFVLAQNCGWKHAPAETLSSSDPLVAFISSELAPVRIGDVPMQAEHPDRHDAPVLAIPLVFRRELAGFVLYGAHDDGADLDGDDERALVPLVNNAAVTYDHLEAQALREEIARLRSLEPAMT